MSGAAGRALPKPGQMVQPHGRPKLAPGATPNNATSGPRVAIVLYPFTLQVKQEVANALLYQFVRYHAYLGFRVLQYTQARSSPGLPAQLAIAHQPAARLVLEFSRRHARAWLRASSALQPWKACAFASLGVLANRGLVCVL